MSENSAVIYVRISTKGQDKYSPDVQREHCRDYAQRHGLEISKEFEEKRSAWKPHARVDYYDMIDFIKKNKIQNVVYAFGDRLSRNSEDYPLLKNTGVRFNDACNNLSFCPNDPADYELTASFEHDQAEAKRSSAKTRKKVIESQAKKIKLGENPAGSPLGYLSRFVLDAHDQPIPIGKDKWKKEIVIDPVAGPLIKKMFELYCTGEYSLSGITEKMEHLGLRSKRRSNVLLREEIRRYLMTPFYYGAFRWNKKLHDNKGTYEPIITKALFDEVQDVMAGRRIIVKTRKDFKYKGLLTCDLCGCAFVGDSHQRTIKTTGKTKTFMYYHCTSGKRKEFYKENFGQDKCPLYYGPYYSEKDIDGFFELAIDSLYTDPNIFEWMQTEFEGDLKNIKSMHAEEIISLKKERSNFERNGSNLVEKSLGANPALHLMYEKELERYGLRIMDIEARLKELETGEAAKFLDKIEDTLVLSKSLKDNYLSANPQKREKYNKLMFSTVRIAKEGWIATHDEDDPYLTAAPFYFVWNQPFKACWEIGFIQGMDEAETESKDQKKVVNMREKGSGGADEA